MDPLSSVTYWISNFIHDTVWYFGLLALAVIIILLAHAFSKNPNMFGNQGGGAV